MTGSAWFSLSVGRNDRADPKWLLPLICKAGGITRDDVGSIKISDRETRFEISASKARDYAERIAKTGSGENGVTITPADRGAPVDRGAPIDRPTGEPQSDVRAFKDKPRFKVRSDKGEKMDYDPLAGAKQERDAGSAQAPGKWKKNKLKDKPKGKPKGKFAGPSHGAKPAKRPGKPGKGP